MVLWEVASSVGPLLKSAFDLLELNSSRLTGRLWSSSVVRSYGGRPTTVKSCARKIRKEMLEFR